MPSIPRHLAVALLFTLTPAILGRPAHAQGQADPTLQAAHARFAEGVGFFDKGQFEKARASFLQAYALHKHPAVLINLAQTSLRSGHPVDAAHYFAQYVRDSPSLTAAQRADAEKGLAEARTKIGHLDITAPTGIAVTVDGDVIGADGNVSADVEPGAHTVKAGNESATITVGAGQVLPIRLVRATAGAIPPPPPPVVVPTPAPVQAAPLPPAPPPREEPTPAPSTSSGPGLFSPPATMVPVWIGAGVGLAGFATAVILGAMKGSAQSSYDTQVSVIEQGISKSQWPGACTRLSTNTSLTTACASLASDGNDVNNDAMAANIGIVVGAVGVGFAAGWYLFAPKAGADGAKTAMPLVQPIIGPRIGGLSVTSSF
jgi:hypothetical protein